MKFDDDLHMAPPEDVPSSPAWDGQGNKCCLAWKSYKDGMETLRARVDCEVYDLITARAVGNPGVLAVRPEGYWIIAPVWDGDKWRCIRFILNDSYPCQQDDLPVNGRFIDSVCMALGDDGAVYLGMAVDNALCSEAKVFRYGKGNCELVLSSSGNIDAYRPALAVVENKPALVYDAWNGNSYQVYMQYEGRCLHISSGKGWDTRPDIVSDDNGCCWICWVRTVDIENPEGVIDSRCEIMLAKVLIAGQPDELELKSFGPVDDLSHGLVDLSSNPRYVWGYLGRRIHPMLLKIPDVELLLWEQKRVHEGETRQNVGVLWCRRLRESKIDESQALDVGGMVYTIPGSHKIDSESFEICCIEGWYEDQRRISLKKSKKTLDTCCINMYTCS